MRVSLSIAITEMVHETPKEHFGNITEEVCSEDPEEEIKRVHHLSSSSAERYNWSSYEQV